MATFVRQWHSWVNTTETAGPENLKYLLSISLQKKFANLWVTVMKGKGEEYKIIDMNAQRILQWVHEFIFKRLLKKYLKKYEGKIQNKKEGIILRSSKKYMEMSVRLKAQKILKLVKSINSKKNDPYK